MSLKPLVNNKDLWDDFNTYLDLRIELYQKSLEQEKDPIFIYRTQGSISALRKLKSLREEVNNG